MNVVLIVAVSVLVLPLVSRYVNFTPTSSFSAPRWAKHSWRESSSGQLGSDRFSDRTMLECDVVSVTVGCCSRDTAPYDSPDADLKVSLKRSRGFFRDQRPQNAEELTAVPVSPPLNWGQNQRTDRVKGR